MTYVRVLQVRSHLHLNGAIASHLAELVRGDCLFGERRPPHPPFVPQALFGKRVFARTTGTYSREKRLVARLYAS